MFVLLLTAVRILQNAQDLRVQDRNVDVHRVLDLIEVLDVHQLLVAVLEVHVVLEALKGNEVTTNRQTCDLMTDMQEQKILNLQFGTLTSMLTNPSWFL